MSHCCNETVSPQCRFNAAFDAPAESVAAFPGTIPIFSGQKMQSISKDTFWNKTKHFIGCPLRNVYIMLNEIKTAGFFLVIVQSHSCVLRASAGQEVELQVAEWTCNLQQLNHQQLSHPILQRKTRVHTHMHTAF